MKGYRDPRRLKSRTRATHLLRSQPLLNGARVTICGLLAVKLTQPVEITDETPVCKDCRP